MPTQAQWNQRSQVPHETCMGTEQSAGRPRDISIDAAGLSAGRAVARRNPPVPVVAAASTRPHFGFPPRARPSRRRSGRRTCEMTTRSGSSRRDREKETSTRPPHGHPGTQKTSASASRRRFGARCPRRLSSKRSSAATTSACPKHSAHSLAFRARCPGRTGAPTNPFGCDPRRSGFAPRCRRYLRRALVSTQDPRRGCGVVVSSADYPRRGRGVSSPRTVHVVAHGVAATRLYGLSTSRPRRLVSTESPRRGRGVAAIHRERIQLAAAASPRPGATEYSRRGRGVAATRLHVLSTPRPRRRRDPVSADYPRARGVAASSPEKTYRRGERTRRSARRPAPPRT